MGKNNILTGKVNFIVSACFIGSSALLGIVTMLEAAERPNPIAEVMAQAMIEAEL